MNFDKWFEELMSDQIWFEPASMHHKPETFKKAAYKVYMSCVADGLFKPMNECRKHVYNIICQIPGDKVRIPWHVQALEKVEQEKKEEWQPASSENVDRYVAQIQEIIKHSPMVNAVPRIGYKQSVEEGGWLPPKQAPYPATSVAEYKIKERHIRYIEMNYEPRTGEKLPDWIPENEFNKLYDQGLI